jgi:DnaJ-class molecular chaperone
MDPLVMLVVIAVAAYVLSLFLHPYAKCDRCGGLGRHSGALFTYANRPCHKCSGLGQKQRFGAALIGRGKRRRSTSRVQPPSRNV